METAPQPSQQQSAAQRNGDLVSGAVLAGLGIYIVLQARGWTYFVPEGPGPGFFPTWYGVAMISLASLLIIRTARRSDAGQNDQVEIGASGRALATWVAFAAAVAIMEVLGFVVSFGLFTFFLVAVLFRRPLLTAAFTAIGSAAAFYLVFSLALGVALPNGVLGF